MSISGEIRNNLGKPKWYLTLSIAIAAIGLCVGSLGLLPRCDDIQTRTAAATQHANLTRTAEKEHTRIYQSIEKNQQYIKEIKGELKNEFVTLKRDLKRWHKNR